MIRIQTNNKITINIAICIILFLYIEIADFFQEDTYLFEKGLLSISLLYLCFLLWNARNVLVIEEEDEIAENNIESGYALYRAKEISTNNFVIGYLLENHIVVNYNINKEENLKIENIEAKTIDTNTLAVSYESMRDDENKRVFASLNKNGLGGDNIWLYNKETNHYVCGTIVFENHQLKVLAHQENNSESHSPEYLYGIELGKTRTIGIETNGVYYANK